MAVIFLFIFPPISWAILWSVYRLVVAKLKDGLEKIVVEDPSWPCSGFCIGFAFTIFGYFPALIGGFILLALINSNGARIKDVAETDVEMQKVPDK
jgi:hypothetical protein